MENNPVNHDRELYNNLLDPKYKITFFKSFLIRLERNYIWLFYLVLLSWLMKLFIIKDKSNIFIALFWVNLIILIIIHTIISVKNVSVDIDI